MSSIELTIIIFLLLIGGCYGTLIILFTVGWSRLKKHKIIDRPNTSISIVVALRNEGDTVTKLIDQLIRQDYPEELFEIILVNDHSTDQTTHLIKNHQANDKIKLLDLGEDSFGKKSAITYGVSHARGKLIVATDADCRYHINWLKTIESYYRQNNYKMLVGPVCIEYDSSWFAQFQALEFNSLQGSGGGAIGIGMPIMCNGANLIYEKNAFDKLEGFKGNEHIPGGDDIFLLEKFINAFGGQSIGYIKERSSIVYTNTSPSLRSYLHQRIRWVAKSPAYRNPFIIFTAIVVFLFNLGLLINWISLIFIHSSNFIAFTIGIVLFKTLIDFPLLWKSTGFFRQRSILMYHYYYLHVLETIFIACSAILGNLLSYKWKGRK